MTKLQPSLTGSRKVKYRFPWRGGNRFQLLVNGEHYFPRMLQAIESARSRVLLEMYLMESGHIAGRFVTALAEAAQRGVQVLLLLDDFGSRGLRNRDRTRLTQSGVQVATFNPLVYRRLRTNLRRDHRKLLSVDSEIAFVGGTGLTDGFDLAVNGAQRWHEVMVEIRGPVIADWERLFQENWNRWSERPHTLAQGPITAVGDQLGRVTYTHSGHPLEIKRSLIKHIRNARERVWIATAYFVPSRKVRRALRQAVARGGDVRLLLPGPLTDHPAVRHAGRRFYGRLLRHGVRIFEYQPSFQHAKVLLCDHWVSIGSSNIDRWNLHWNLEANQEIHDPDFAANVRALFETDFALSKEFRLAEWRRRPWSRRLLERFWGIVDIWLERYSQLAQLRQRRP